MDKGAIITGLVTFTAALLLWRKTMVERTDSQIQKEHMLYQLRELQRLSSALQNLWRKKMADGDNNIISLRDKLFERYMAVIDNELGAIAEDFSYLSEEEMIWLGPEIEKMKKELEETMAKYTKKLEVDLEEEEEYGNI